MSAGQGQLSLEALIALCALFAFLSILIASAQGIAKGAEGKAREASARHSLAYGALCLDTAAQSIQGAVFHHSLPGVPDESGGALASPDGGASERLFYAVTSDSGGNRYVQHGGAEPV